MRKKHKRRALKLEAHHQPLLSRGAFIGRLFRYFLASTVVIGVSLGIGMVGYHYLEELAWIDSFCSASMILSGMGPLNAPHTWEGKLFAGVYALYSGLALLVAAGILFAPVVHRLLHLFHLQVEEEQK
jgi:hypothetical protein